jgi:protein phosphatase 1L
MTRAIGDVMLQPYVTSTPEIQVKEMVPEDEYLVLASDGLWDVLGNEEVAKIVWNYAPRDFLYCAKHLCSEALIMGSTDNITVMVIDLK